MSNTMIVINIAITPSLKASSRDLSIAKLHSIAAKVLLHFYRILLEILDDAR